MLARRTLALTKSLVGSNGFQLRTSTISGPARVKVSSGEMAVLGLVITLGVSFFPAWVLVNIPAYRGGAAE
ncbi:hypothetical protein DAPPUDRAFT_311453 [Daphnia pulex]|uniref:Uncharacterized protein n=1 Tax=Daphnia pulex TaxID=6669 RepID=E9FWY1_DAPPU|nr:hypothetical protein DAPPUDRAFT_311453 [Daphnia pulex]|eukprot:EFX88356.1 hypothetical protein DAPPUDRAFT_311453 [Daphnia pulex]